MAYIRIVLWLCLASIWNGGFSQEAELPVSEWRTKLSVKKDAGFVHWQEVFMDLYTLGLPQCCEALEHLSRQSEKRSTRYQIRLSLLTKELRHNNCHCPGYPDEIELLQKALRQAYEIGDNVLASQVNLSLGHGYFVKGELSLSIMHYLTARRMMEAQGLELYRNYSYTLYFIADLHYKVRDYPASHTHFNYPDAEHTIIRGGKPGAHVVLNELGELGNMGIGCSVNFLSSRHCTNHSTCG